MTLRRFAFVLLIALPVSVWADQANPIPVEEALEMFVHPEDVRIEIVAAEPEVFDPVALCFDAQARLYVVEDSGYPTIGLEGEAALGKVVLLEDADGDGRYEKRTVFAEGFSFPNGLMPWRGGVLLSCAPELWYLEDTDGDGHADVREAVLTGFSLGGSTQLRTSHPTLGLDNWIHMTNGLSGGEIVSTGYLEGGNGESRATDRNAYPTVKMGNLDLRFNPQTGEVQTFAGQGQFGLAFDDTGRKFVCSNRKHIEQIIFQQGDLSRNPILDFTETVADIPDHGGAARIYALSEATTTAFAHAGTFTAACGVVVYRGDALPETYRGNSFTCDPTGNLVHRDRLVENGGALIAQRVHDGVEFLATTDNWSRPVFLANGPDGALYLCDMYRKSIEHPVYLPPEVAAVTDFRSGEDRGRIYRITAVDASASGAAVQAATFTGQNADAVVARLKDPGGWVRDTAQRLMLEGTVADVETPLRETLEAEGSPLAKVHALSLLDGLGYLNANDLGLGISHSDARVRARALVTLRTHPEFQEPLHEQVAALADDANARVRFLTALALGDFAPPRNLEALSRIAAQNIADRWSQAAVLSSVPDELPAFAKAMLKNAPDNTESFALLSERMGRMLARSADDSGILAFAELLLLREARLPDAVRMAGVYGLCEGVRSAAKLGGTGAALHRLIEAAPPGASDALRSLLSDAEGACEDTNLPSTRRAVAVALLGYTSYDEAGDRLAALLTPRAPQELQLAAVHALGKIEDERVGQVLTAPDRWGAMTSAVRSAAMSAVLARPDRTRALLDQIEAGAIPAWNVDASGRAAMQNSRDEEISKRAKTVFADVKRTNRSEAFNNYKRVLDLAPNLEAGKTVFANNCATCHQYNGVGHEVGPDLTGIASQPKESILLHVIDPNWLLVPGFENFAIETKEGDYLSGLIASETETTLTLKQPLGITTTIQRQDIESMTTASLSMMPEELERGMSDQDLCDLIGFLKGE